ncbi:MULTISPECIES: outer membrane protein [Rickettsieae]|jgi:opacity protein-like surface antigen|uniref:outer membrane protein n=1 Tax=Rickettsieae TaxID=33988 RepID=UPI000B9C7396|nr:outer membrane beta-barrel protein [Rickettsia endosymbiont of Culicoides newsteadi]OZG32146.1 adhesin [Rickettsia endosymbiont of Culicoides newsteadi]
MKNLLLLTIISVSLLFSASSWAIDNQFYLKVEVGANKMNNIKLNDKELQQNTAAIVGGGVGYYVLDNVRLDLMLDFFANQQVKHSFAGVDSKIKPQITTLVLSGYVDIFDISICELFIGAGAGVGHLKNEITNNKLGTSVSNSKKNNLVYHLTFGAAAKLAPVIKVEVAYSWKNLGSTKEIKNHVKSLPYKGHNVTLGIRFDV